MELGIIGLGRMGANMTERLVLGGHRMISLTETPRPFKEWSTKARWAPARWLTLSGSCRCRGRFG